MPESQLNPVTRLSGRGARLSGRGARLRRAGPLAAVLACVAVLGAACSSSPGTGSTDAAGGQSSGQGASSPGTGNASTYAACMRSHGVPNFPDPNGKGAFEYTPGSGIDPSSPKFQAASKACASLIPQAGSGPPGGAGSPGGGNGSQPGTQAQAQFAVYANCMQSHGVSNFPGPGSSDGSVQVKMPTTINPDSQTFQKAQAACQSLMPGGGPGFSP